MLVRFPLAVSKSIAAKSFMEVGVLVCGAVFPCAKLMKKRMSVSGPYVGDEEKRGAETVRPLFLLAFACLL
jgi:hypothetical protein